jgi:hypothetical protein
MIVREVFASQKIFDIENLRGFIIFEGVTLIFQMASNFPKLPGYTVLHDPTIANHKKVSHVKLD